MDKKIVKIVTGSLLIFVIAVFYLSKILNCNQAECHLDLAAITWVPYTDFSENIVGGMSASKGLIFGDGYASPHAPGIYIILALVYKLTSLSTLLQSSYSMMIWTGVSIISFTIIYLIVLTSALRNVYVATSFLGLLALLFYPNDVFFPMSEFVALIVGVALYYEYIKLQSCSCDYDDVTKVVAFSALILFCGIGYVGLVVAPLLFFKKERWVVLLNKKNIMFIFAVLSGVILLLVTFTNLQKLWFWLVSVNVTVGSELKRNITLNLVTSKDNIKTVLDVFLWIPFQLFVVSCLVAAKVISYRVSLVIFFGVISCYWRQPWGYKVVPAAAPILALMLYTFMQLRVNKIKVSLGLFFAGLFIMCYLYNRNVLIEYKNIAALRQDKIEFFDNYNICKLTRKSEADCKCVTFLSFGPQVFSQNDLLQCPNQMGTYAEAMGLNDRYYDTVIATVEGGRAIYYVPSKTSYQQTDRLASIVSRIENSGYECKGISGGARICESGFSEKK